MGSIQISGIVRITTDAEARKSTNGTFFTFGVAAYRKFVKEGKQDVDFFDATIYSKKPTPALEANLKKGRLLFIEGGSLLNDKFIGNDGKEKSKVKLQIAAYEFFNQGSSSGKVEQASETKSDKKEPVEKAPIKQEIIPEPEDEPSEDEEEVPF